MPLFDILVRERLLDAEQAEQLRRRAQAEWQPLGKVLRQRGYLNMEQLIELLDRQAREPRTQLGELAVRAGHCTRAQLDECLARQRELSPHPVELLLREQGVDPERLLRALIPYLRELEATQGVPREA